MIILEPMGGLANRMRVIASGLWLKDQMKAELSVIWNQNYELNCPFDLLLQDPGLFSITKKAHKYNYVRSSFPGNPGDKIKRQMVNRLIGVDRCIQEDDFYKLIWPGQLRVQDLTARYGTTYIQTCQEFGENLAAFRHFKPAAPVAEKMDQVLKNFTAHTIGVHIRRTDNANAIRFSPTELFMQKMNEACQRQPDAHFFLCTDDPGVEQTIRSEFGDKVIVHEKELDRNSVAGMQDAAAELFCLSKTRKILGSYWSSFSDIAARLNGAELEVLKCNVGSGLSPDTNS